MFLGMVLVSEDHAWHTGFVLWTLALCFVTRFLSECLSYLMSKETCRAMVGEPPKETCLAMVGVPQRLSQETCRSMVECRSDG